MTEDLGPSFGDGVTDSYNATTSLTVRAIKAQGSQLFVGGGFATAGGQTANNVAAWDGSNWSTLGYGVDGAVFAIETTDTDVYVGGNFTNAYNFPFSGYTVNRIALWNASAGWSPLGSGVLLRIIQYIPIDLTSSSSPSNPTGLTR